MTNKSNPRNLNNLIPVNRSMLSHNGSRSQRNTLQFPVPKCVFLNICNLNKTKNNLRASIALAADLRTLDIDIAVISETHLNHNIPDCIVGIEGYDIFRRDRDLNGKDKRKNGGIAVYVRQHLKIV